MKEYEFIFLSKNNTYKIQTKSILKIVRTLKIWDNGNCTGALYFEPGDRLPTNITEFSDGIFVNDNYEGKVFSFIDMIIEKSYKIEKSFKVSTATDKLIIKDKKNDETVFDSSKVIDINYIQNPIFLSIYLFYMEIIERPIGRLNPDLKFF